MDESEEIKKTTFHQPALLRGESASEFASFSAALWGQLEPEDAIEAMWGSEIITGEWETLRLRHTKTKIISSYRPEALLGLLQRLSENFDRASIDELVRGYFKNKAVREKVRSLLRGFDLDDTSIDA